MVEACFTTIDNNFDMLGQIDAVAGDGDHGIGMRRGLAAGRRAAADAVQRGAGVGTVLRLTGDAWSDRAGGTSGAIWGAALDAAGVIIGDNELPDAGKVSAAIDAATDAVLSFGASVGDKTIVDALLPFKDGFAAAITDGADISSAWTSAAAARAAADATAELLPHIGRARPHAEKSLGTPDPGAISFALLTETISQQLHGNAAPLTAK